MERGKLIYKTKSDRGFVFTCFNFPAYKVWNIPAHSNDIIQSELDKDTDGYRIAGSDGLGGNVFG